MQLIILGAITFIVGVSILITQYRQYLAEQENRMELDLQAKRNELKARVMTEEREAITKPAIEQALGSKFDTSEEIPFRLPDMTKWGSYPENDLYILQDEKYIPEDTQSMAVWSAAMDEIDWNELEEND